MRRRGRTPTTMPVRAYRKMFDDTPDSENPAFLPKAPPKSMPSGKQTRWAPASTRHVIVSPEALNKQSDLDSPYNPNPFNIPDLESTGIYEEVEGAEGEPSQLKRKTLWKRIKLTVLNRGYVPLVLRLISFIFSIAALLLAAF